VKLSAQDTFKLNESKKSNNFWKTSLRITALTMLLKRCLVQLVVNTIIMIIKTIKVLKATMEMMLSP